MSQQVHHSYFLVILAERPFKVQKAANFYNVSPTGANSERQSYLICGKRKANRRPEFTLLPRILAIRCLLLFSNQYLASFARAHASPGHVDFALSFRTQFQKELSKCKSPRGNSSLHRCLLLSWQLLCRDSEGDRLIVYKPVLRNQIADALIHLRELFRQRNPSNERERLTHERR